MKDNNILTRHVIYLNFLHDITHYVFIFKKERKAFITWVNLKIIDRYHMTSSVEKFATSIVEKFAI